MNYKRKGTYSVPLNVSAAQNAALKHFSELVFSNQELGISHNPYDQELREMASIEHGDLNALQKSLNEQYPGQIGRLAKDDLRNKKNLAIVNVTLACRAAIRGGIMPEISFSLSDALIQTIETCNDIHEIEKLTVSLKYQYTSMVKNMQDSRQNIAPQIKNYHIEKCKNYISAHLHGKHSVQEIADALALNASYLSDLFRKCEGMTITAFIKQQKITLTQNLLIYSRYSYSEIASYLGYASQSHLGKQFKEITGLTLRQYRELHGIKYFEKPHLLDQEGNLPD